MPPRPSVVTDTLSEGSIFMLLLPTRTCNTSQVSNQDLSQPGRMFFAKIIPRLKGCWEELALKPDLDDLGICHYESSEFHYFLAHPRGRLVYIPERRDKVRIKRILT